MEINKINIGSREIKMITCNTAVVGTGAAGYSAANRLYEMGQKDIVIVTEGKNMGTSRNTGSDKQTYYKLSLCGDFKDSIEDMAETYFQGGSMDGDLALCEAAFSTRCFYYLCEAGVPFPHNKYGEYTGYKTDHDPAMRATSAGPLTSKFMTESLEAKALEKKITIIDNCIVIRILTNRDSVVGLLALDEKTNEFIIFNTTNVIYATGGPAGIYENAVYPPSQTGSTGIALEAGVTAKNITEWQYGIASTKFRWNLSGSYQQVLPCYISTDINGGDEKEFLDEYFSSSEKLLEAIFLKGYQWPFDPRKVDDEGSSLVDILVYKEIAEKKRRVFLDFRRNPSCLNITNKDDFKKAGKLAYEYLENSKSLQDTPIERLANMNPKAIELYINNGIDLYKEPLEIAVCAQHNNGGLSGDIWWESNLNHFFPIGEVNGSHGTYRPGGSALNSGQVGALRASIRIVNNYTEEPMEENQFLNIVSAQIEEKIKLAENFTDPKHNNNVSISDLRTEVGNLMSNYCGHIRNQRQIEYADEELLKKQEQVLSTIKISSQKELGDAFRLYDTIITSRALVAAIKDYIEEGGVSRGSYLIERDNDATDKGVSDIEKTNEEFSKRIQEVQLVDNTYQINWRQVREIPRREQWFENVWREFDNVGRN